MQIMIRDVAGQVGEQAVQDAAGGEGADDRAGGEKEGLLIAPGGAFGAEALHLLRVGRHREKEAAI